MMMKIDLLIPSRGRPEDARRAATSALNLASRQEPSDSVAVFVVIDTDDSTGPQYDANAEEHGYNIVRVENSGRRGIVDPLNVAAVIRYARGCDYIGFMGDDHRVRTPDWDEIVSDHSPAAVVYGDDGFQGANLPTAVFLRADIIGRLGFMAPPTLQHLYVDNYWKALGEKLDSIVYDPNLKIEHLHPEIPDGNGGTKGQWDTLKVELNSQEMFTKDRVAFMQYEAGGGIDKDARRILEDTSNG
jgi:hypothetical protein